MCLKGKSEAKVKKGNFICKKCDAVSKKSDWTHNTATAGLCDNRLPLAAYRTKAEPR